jgi:hypothetical protein
MGKQTIDSNILAALIGAGVSLLVLILTIFWERWKANADLKEQRRKKLIYCAALIKPIISYSDKQAENIRRFAEMLQDNPLEFPLLTFAPKSDLDKFIHKVDEEALFDAFTSVYKPYEQSVKQFKGITSTINYQNLQMDQVLEMVKTSQDLDHERKLKFKTSLKAAMDLAASSIADQSMQQHTGLLALLDKNLFEYISHRQSASDLKYAYEAFVDPVMKGIVENQFYQISIGSRIANHLHDASEIYHDIIMQMDSLKEDFFTISEAYSKSNESLRSHSDKLLQNYFEELD